ncbi:hypothetical protein D3C80_1969930 [compost metagenome]
MGILQTAEHPVYRVLRGPVIFRQFFQQWVLGFRYFFLPREGVQACGFQVADSPRRRLGQPGRESVFHVLEVNACIGL